MLKRLVKSLEEVDEKYHDLYEADGDNGFILKTDDKDYKAQLDEFRNNNRVLFNDKAAMEENLAKFKDMDPAKYEEAIKALDVLNQYEEKQLLKDGKLEDVLSIRTKAMQADYDTQITALQSAVKDAIGQKEKYQGQLGSLRVEAIATKALSTVGRLRAAATTDALSRANATWKLGDDGRITAHVDGKAAYGLDGEALTPDEWAKNLLKSAPHLFEKGTGGGSEGSSNNSNNHSQDPKVINRNDIKTFGLNLEDIASGKVTAV